MIVIANDYGNKAVWGALKMHIDFLVRLDKDINLLIPQKYIDDIKEENLPYNIIPYDSTLDEIKLLYRVKDNEIFAPDIFGVLYGSFAKLKKKKIYYWMQGSTPEESFMKYSSKTKYAILNFLEKLALKLSSGYIFVSEYMREYVEQKYKQSFEPSIVVPCISDIKYSGAVKEKDSFVYVGGMSVWQRVDKMLLLFNQIKKAKPNAKFYIATRETKRAKELIDTLVDKEFAKDVILTSFDSREAIEEFLSTKEFGFLIRDDSVVNYVASPIKLAEYLACGVNVIISESVKSYAPLVSKYQAGVVVKYETIDTNLLTSNSQNALKLYSDIFDSKNHIKSYNMLLNSGRQNG